MAITSFSKLLVEIGVDLSRFSKDLKKASAGFENFGKEMTKIGKTLTVDLTAPIAGFAAAAFSQSKEATRAFAEFASSTKENLGRVGTDIFRALNVQAILDKVSIALREMTDAFVALPPVVKNTALVVGGFVAALGPALLLVGQLSTLIGKLAGTLKVFLSAAALIGIGPFGLLAVAITAVASAVALLTLNAGRARAEVSNFELSAGAAAKRIGEIKAKLEELNDSSAEAKVRLAEARAELEALQKIRPPDIPARPGTDIISSTARREAIDVQIARQKKEIAELEAKVTGLTAAKSEQEAVEIRLGQIIKESGEATRKLTVSYAAHKDEVRKLGDEIEILENENKKLLDLQVGGVAVAAESIAANEREIASLRQRKDALEEARREREKGIEAEKEAIRQLADIDKGVRNAQNRSSLLGGGVNLNQVALDAEIERYNILTAARNRDNDAIAASRARIEELSAPLEVFKGLLQSLPPLGQQIGQVLFDVTQQFISGVAQAVAQAIVFGQNLGKALVQVLKQVAASIIASLIQIGVQRLILAVLGVGAAAKEASASMAAAVGLAGAAAVAHAILDLGLIGLASSGAWAAAGVAAALAGGAAGITAGAALGAGGVTAAAAAAEGGIFTRPNFTSIAERGEPEIVLNQDNVRRFFAGTGLPAGGGNVYHFGFNLNGRTIGEAVVTEIPGILRYHGVNI